MGKTVSQLTSDELKQYDPTRNLGRILDPVRWQRAQDKLPQLLLALRQQFGAERIRVFGLLAVKALYKRWPVIVLAVWGVPPEWFDEALVAVNEISQEIKVDLVDPARCKSQILRADIHQAGIDV